MYKLAPCVIAVAVLTGCPGVRMLPLRDLSLRAAPPLDAPLRSARRILVMPFSDERGGTWARATATSHIPVVSLFHSGEHFYYPEQSGALRSDLDGHGQMASGALESAMPDLITSMMRRMNLTPHAFTIADGGEYDYLVRGRLRTTRYSVHSSVLTGVLLGVFGVPCFFTDYYLEYEVELYAGADHSRALMKRSYRFSGSRTGGLYYNAPSAYGLFTRSLEQTLPRVVQDLAVAIALDGHG